MDIVSKFPWYDLPQEIQEHILSMCKLKDEDLIDLVDTFKVAGNLVKVFTFDNKKRGHEEYCINRRRLFKLCPKVRQVVMHSPRYSLELMGFMAEINPFIESFRFFEGIKSTSPQMYPIIEQSTLPDDCRFVYLCDSLKSSPGHNCSQFKDALSINRANVIINYWKLTSLRTKIEFKPRCLYWTDQLVKDITTVRIYEPLDVLQNDVIEFLKRCPRLEQLEIVLKDYCNNFKVLMSIKTLKSVSIFCLTNGMNEKIYDFPNVSNLEQFEVRTGEDEDVSCMQVKGDHLFFQFHYKVTLNPVPFKHLIKYFPKVVRCTYYESHGINDDTFDHQVEMYRHHYEEVVDGRLIKFVRIESKLKGNVDVIVLY